MVLTTKQKELRTKILEEIYVHGPISRIEISKYTNITPATISEITGSLIKENLIYELGEASSENNRSGRKRILLDISERHSFYIGCELSEKHMTFCLTDNTGTIYAEKVIKFNTENDINAITEVYFIEEINNFIEDLKSYHPKAIGIALPGHFNDKNKTIYSNNTIWKNFDLSILIENLTLPIYFKNNVHCMANAERFLSKDNIDDNFIFFHVGRGMFCSHINNGRTYGENKFLVGEVGHIIVHPDGELCECGKRGCLQTYASEAWIIKKSRILYENSNTTFLRQLTQDKQNITIETVLKAYTMGDEGVTNILNNAIKYLSITINNLPLMIDTNNLILHGELFNEPTLAKLLGHYINQNNILPPLNHLWDISLKPYSDINGALAACSLAISQSLIQKR
ncbi:ROK family transcriptional regulator [Bacillus sp. FJAT-27916]|uniref:ROK family transcriptional regulator n=1 Tax=Bacillus sp. FJAT-27916 TaxID=1679169 RepID=UPI00067142DA|nr:ROK family transcriptional regulator [Bacillus sp. FJAT-27916]KMY44655.1 ROK family transcriptional regulator [Bacillus sp. FJAT-27916]